jgi:ABC-type multidrug transport system ATPase subunit
VAGPPDAVSAVDLWRGYGWTPVLRGVSLAVSPGQSLAILGPNGSGKSTLLRVMSAALRPQRGRIRIFGEDPFADLLPRRMIGFVGHEPMLYGGLSVMENLGLLATLYDLSDGGARVTNVCQLLGIDRSSAPVRRLSRGLQQRAALARALLHRPSVLLLDEPFTGLDPEGADALRSILQEFSRSGGATVLTTHSPAEAIRVADAAAVLAGGRLTPPRRLAGTDPATLRAWYAVAAGGVIP